jgi:hypothetical protein
LAHLGYETEGVLEEVAVVHDPRIVVADSIVVVEAAGVANHADSVADIDLPEVDWLCVHDATNSLAADSPDRLGNRCLVLGRLEERDFVDTPRYLVDSSFDCPSWVDFDPA